MKFSINLLMMFISISGLMGQNNKLSLSMELTEKGNYYLLKEGDLVIDSILRTHTKNSILLDYQVINKKKVLFITKDIVGYFYYNTEKTNGVWSKSISSGMIEGNHEMSGAYISKEILDKQYTILDEDKILIKTDKEERIFDCNIITNRNRDHLNKVEKLRKN